MQMHTNSNHWATEKAVYWIGRNHFFCQKNIIIAFYSLFINVDALVPFNQEVDFYENAVYVMILSPLFKINLVSFTDDGGRKAALTEFHLIPCPTVEQLF